MGVRLSHEIHTSSKRNQATWVFVTLSLFAMYPPIIAHTFKATTVQENHAISRGMEPSPPPYVDHACTPRSTWTHRSCGCSHFVHRSCNRTRDGRPRSSLVFFFRDFTIKFGCGEATSEAWVWVCLSGRALPASWGWVGREGGCICSWRGVCFDGVVCGTSAHLFV